MYMIQKNKNFQEHLILLISLLSVLICKLYNCKILLKLLEKVLFGHQMLMSKVDLPQFFLSTCTIHIYAYLTNQKTVCPPENWNVP